MTHPASRQLKDISPKAYEHPADRAATAALQSIPMLDTVMRKLIELRYERALRQGLMAGSVRLGPTQLPDAWAAWEDVVSTLDLPETYDVYLTHYPIANAAAIGAQKPIVVLNSAGFALFDRGELQTVLGHEAGHILSDHMLYQTALQILLLLPLGRAPVLAGLPALAIRTALLEWARAAELSCDRAATLVNRDPVVTARTLMVLAAGLRSENLDVDSFLRQGQDYHEWGSAFDRLSRQLNELNLTHSSPVRRVSQLMDWVRSGAYDRIVGGDYRRRGDPVDAGAEAEQAYGHYRERFQKIFEEADEGFSNLAERMNDWLRQIRR